MNRILKFLLWIKIVIPGCFILFFIWRFSTFRELQDKSVEIFLWAFGIFIVSILIPYWNDMGRIIEMAEITRQLNEEIISKLNIMLSLVQIFSIFASENVDAIDMDELIDLSRRELPFLETEVVEVETRLLDDTKRYPDTYSNFFEPNIRVDEYIIPLENVFPEGYRLNPL